MTNAVIYGCTFFTDLDIHLFKAGNHFKLYEKLGAHPCKFQEKEGVYFSLWAPNAKGVCVVGDFNGWNTQSHPLAARWDSSGIWEGFIPHIKVGDLYKFHVESKYHAHAKQKADPFAFLAETPPKTGSIVADLTYTWKDEKWMKVRKEKNAHDAPLAIYELHLGSFKKNGCSQNYRDLAKEVTQYVLEMGYTHVELLPIMEHPFYGSWGYQTIGYFSPTSRYGTPQDFMFFVDYLHQNGIGVILDFSLAHFPNDEYGLGFFDGTHLYEHEDIKLRLHPDWNSYIFNYGRNEVRSFLISSAFFFLEKYHLDGIRCDAVASMLYLDYSRKANEWIPNIYGGKENLEAIEFIKILNKSVHEHFPGVVTIAEESTSWPMVTRPVEVGGLGFDYKWNMGWMHDTLQYFSKDPIFRKYHHNEISFSMWYNYSENFILVLSHDEVVHGKGSLYQKMPGDDWQKYANIRLLFGYQYAHPGKKLLFMGSDLGQRWEWNHEVGIDWNFPAYSYQTGVKNFVKDLNKLYREKQALYKKDYLVEGFEWVDNGDYEKSILCFIRKSSEVDELLILCNFTPSTYQNYRVGVPKKGKWKEILSSDNAKYGGSGIVSADLIHSDDIPFHGRAFSLSLHVPPLAIVIYEMVKT